MAKVGIVMGSDSDMPVMAQAAAFLEKMGIEYEMRLISDREHLSREDTGVLAAVDRNGRTGNAARHLHNRVERIHTAEI